MYQLIIPIAAILITTYAIAVQHRQTTKPTDKNKLNQA